MLNTVSGIKSEKAVALSFCSSSVFLMILQILFCATNNRVKKHQSGHTNKESSEDGEIHSCLVKFFETRTTNERKNLCHHNYRDKIKGIAVV